MVLAVAAWQAEPSWQEVFHQADHPTNPPGENLFGYWYYAITLFGAAMTPYEVFFLSSAPWSIILFFVTRKAASGEGRKRR